LQLEWSCRMMPPWAVWWKFSKVSSLRKRVGKITAELIFENFDRWHAHSIIILSILMWLRDSIAMRGDGKGPLMLLIWIARLLVCVYAYICVFVYILTVSVVCVRVCVYIHILGRWCCCFGALPWWYVCVCMYIYIHVLFLWCM